MATGLVRHCALGALLAGAVLVQAADAAACGGFFCSQTQPVNQAAERIIFANNGDGTVTAVIQILYEGPSENFSWLLPISTVPQGDDIAVASDLAFARLQQATNPQYNLNTRIEGTCKTCPNCAGGPGMATGAVPTASPEAPATDNAGGVTVAASGIVGSFEWTVLELDPQLPEPADAAVMWLTANGYDVTPGAEALIGPYLQQGMYLLALRLTKGSDSGSIRPIVLTYDAAAPAIPIKLTAVAANDDMGVMTWVSAPTRAVPFNYNALELNEARINWFNAASNYNDVVIAAADDAGGQGFVTEYAGAASPLAQAVWQDFEEQQWQQFRTNQYSSFDDIYQQSVYQYSGFDGFWDAVRAVVTLPQGVTFDDLKLCPIGCYQVQFSPTQYMNALEDNVIKPMRDVRELLERQPYVTRFYSTLSAADMTLDPVFAFNADLGTVSNVHTADRIIECNPNVYQQDANWRIELPQGGIIRGGPQDVGTWPAATQSLPPNFRVLKLGTAGPPAVVRDNADAINDALAEIPAPPTAAEPTTPTMSGNGDPMMGDPMTGPDVDTPARIKYDDGGCTVSHAQRSSGAGAFWASALGMLGALAARRRRRLN